MKVERTDLCVIGSGAAGAFIAFDAARQGRQVLLLERGPRVSAAHMTLSERDMVPRLYKDGGLQTNASMDVFILQGCCVGGSTVVANMVMLRPAPALFAAWDHFGAALDQVELAHCYDRIDKLLAVQAPARAIASETTRLFERGALSLGLEPRWMKKALGPCRACGGCNVGCAFDTKRSANATFVPWAEELGARVLPDTDVIELVHRGGQVKRIEARRADGERVSIEAKQVVVAAGAIGSSALLLNSGVRRNVGTRLSFNLATSLVAEFNESLDAYDADQMNAYVQHDGYLLEATHNPVMSAALTTPGWFADHGELMRRQRQLAYAGVLIPTEPSGRVVLSRLFGHEEAHYQVSQREVRLLRRGLATLGRIFLAAGAERVILPTRAFRPLHTVAELANIDEHIQSGRDLLLGSAHPQGGNPLSCDPRRGVVDADFAVHGFSNLFVCDASVFPTPVGVNPMATVMALAAYAVPRIMARS